MSTSCFAGLRCILEWCWRLLRQRRTLRESGYDSNETKVRDENPVEGYLQ